MITLKVLSPIKDTSANKVRLKDEQFQVTKERYDEMNAILKGNFNKFFELVAIEKTKKKDADTTAKPKRK